MSTSTILSDNGVSSGTTGLKTAGGDDGTLVLQTTTSGGTATTAMTIDTNQKVSVNTFAVNSNNISADNSLGFRNRIINGDMRIDQRNAGASITPTDGQYATDRFSAGLTQASKFTLQQVTDAPAGFINSLKATSSSAYSVAAGDLFEIRQLIEGTNCADLAWGSASAKTVTLSFWVKSSLTGTFGGALGNSAGDRSYPFTYSISSANTWEQKSVTIAGDTTGTWLTTTGIGIRVRFSLGTGSTYSGTAGAWAAALYTSATGATSVVGTNGATWYITGVQLEVGSVATPFERRPYGTELALCQRYYFKKNFAAGCYVNQLQAYSTSAAYGKLFDFPVQMRATPTGSVSAASHFRAANAAASAAAAFTSAPINGLTPTSAGTDGWTGSSGLAAGNATTVDCSNANGWIDVTAEL